MLKRYSKLQPPIFEELEPRLLFSADIAEALVVDAVEQDFEEQPAIFADLEPVTEQSAAVVVVPSDPVTPEEEASASPKEETETDTSLELAPEDPVTDSAIADITLIETTTSLEEASAVAEPLESSTVSARKELILVNDNVNDIDQLVAGDTVMFTTDAGDIPYQVTGTQVVNPDAIWIVDPTDTPTATLFACHQPGSVAQRIVVNLQLAG